MCQKAVHKNFTNSQENICDGDRFSKVKGLQPKKYYKRTQSLRFPANVPKISRAAISHGNFEKLPLTTLFEEYWTIYLKTYNMWIFRWCLKHQLLPVVHFQVPHISIFSLQADRNDTFRRLLMYWKHACFETHNSMGFPICNNCDIHWRCFWVKWSVALLDGYQFHCERLQMRWKQLLVGLLN